MSKPITITSQELRHKVETYTGKRIPTRLWERAEEYARHKLNTYRERWPEKVDVYDEAYLVILTADTVEEIAFSDRTLEAIA